MPINYDRAKFEKEVKLSEDLSLTMYTCPTGHLTIGWGHNLEANPISTRAAQVILEDDINNAEKDLYTVFPWVRDMDPVRQRAMMDMSFNMGITTMRQFTTSMPLLQQSKWIEAGRNLRASLWYRQTGRRAERVIRMLETGEEPRV